MLKIVDYEIKMEKNMMILIMVFFTYWVQIAHLFNLSFSFFSDILAYT